MADSKSTPLPQASILPDWFSAAAGRALIETQVAVLERLIPDQFYRVGLQYGLCECSAFGALNVEQTVYIDAGTSPNAEAGNRVIALPEAMPFADSGVDLALLFHTLDYCEDPHRVLREASQMLSPEGVLVLTGFHPFSLWGARRRFSQGQAPFDARFISRTVVQDWLGLLGFQTVSGCTLNYQPPQLNARWRERLSWMDKVGDRWWPTLGAVYVLVVQKKIYSGLGLKSSVKSGKKWFPEFKPAQSKIAHTNSTKNSHS